jgi:diguanylate cyclase (GGDEF)-like protein
MSATSAEHQIQRILVFLALVALVLAFHFDSFLEMEALLNEPVTEWEGPWTIAEDGNIIARNVTLPYTISGPYLGKTFTISMQLPAELPNHHTAIAVDTSMSSLLVKVDDELIYSFTGPKKGWKRPVYGGATTHFVRIDDRFQGKKLSLIYAYTSNNSFAGHIRPVLAGSKASLLLTKFQEWPSFFFGFSLLLLGTLIFVFSFAIQTKDERKSFFYFGLVLLMLGSWVFSQTPSKFLFFRNPALLINLSFFSLYLLPNFLVNYIYHSYPVHRRIRHFRRISLFFILVYVLGAVLQVLGITQYTDLLLVSGLALALFLLSLFACLFIEYLKGNSKLSSFLLAMGFLLFSILAEVVLLAMNITLESAVILHFGMAMAAVVLFWHSITLVRQKTEGLLKEQMLLEMAYTDALTAVGNRASYERELERITKKTHLEPLGVLMMDINDLKLINDREGHKAGDLILKDFSQRLVHLLPHHAKVFRYGGDEFLAIIPSVTEISVQNLANTVLEYFSTSQKVTYQVAVGSAVYIPKKKEKFANIVSKADDAMYRCKADMKAQKA